MVRFIISYVKIASSSNICKLQMAKKCFELVLHLLLYTCLLRRKELLAERVIPAL